VVQPTDKPFLAEVDTNGDTPTPQDWIIYLLKVPNLLSKYLIAFSNLLVYFYQKALIFSVECSFSQLEIASKTVLNHCLHWF
jgi:hypothetical protein